MVIGYTGQVPDTPRAHDWRDSAACLTEYPELFYSTFLPDVDAAKAVCARCPVRAECLAAAVASEEHGTWGGTTAYERHLLRRPEREPAPEPVPAPDPGLVHGDRRTYRKHKCRCPDCRHANAVYNAELAECRKHKEAVSA